MVGSIGILRALWLLLQKDFKVMRRRKVCFVIEIVVAALCILFIMIALKTKPVRTKLYTDQLDVEPFSKFKDNEVGIIWPPSFTPLDIKNVAKFFNLTCPYIRFKDGEREGERVDLFIKTFQYLPKPILDFEVLIATHYDVQLPSKKLHYNLFGSYFNKPSTLENHELNDFENKAYYTQACINKVFMKTARPGFAPKFNITRGNLPYLTYLQRPYILVGCFTSFLMISTVCLAMKEVASEKQSGVHMYLRASGLPRFVFYLSHFIFASLKIFAVTGIESILSSIFDKSMTVKLMPVLMLYGNIVCAYALVGSTFLKRSIHVILFTVFVTLAPMFLSNALDNYMFNSTFTLIMSFLNPTLAFYNILQHYDISFLHARRMSIFKGYSNYLPVVYPYTSLVLHLEFLIALAFYIDAVLVSDGMPKLHPLFFLGFRRRSKTDESLEKGSSEACDSDRYQPPSASGEVLLEVNNLVKTWANGETAVDNVSFKVHAGQVVTLLGHNGAGKTTTFSCLTGFLKPTSGSIQFYGDERVGYCPQFNPLFSKLTVIEHMEFYCRFFTGTCPDDTVLQATMEKIELYPFESTYAQDLSGGSKRKLSFGIALLSGANVILLDEPTAGIDTSSRRNMIKLIKNLKANRAVVLTTHHMDEADALSDHINIMCKGKLICSGSSEFLKAKFGAGFLLVVDLTLSPREEEFLDNTAKHILQMVKNYCPEAEFYGTVSSQFNIVIPVEFRPRFAKMFAELESKRADLNIDSFDVMMNTLDQVFVNVTREAAEAETENDPTENKVTEFIEQVNDVRSGPTLIFFQIAALLLRKFHYFRRDFLQVILVLTVLGIIIDSIIMIHTQMIDTSRAHPDSGSANLILSDYFNMAIGIVTVEPGFVSNFTAPLEALDYPNIDRIDRETMTDFEDETLPKKLARNMFKLPVPGFYYLVDLNNVIVLKNTGFHGGQYVALQTLFNALFPDSINATLTYQRLTLDKPPPVAAHSRAVIIAAILALSFTTISAVNVFLYTYERSNGIHHLYARTRLSSIVYWLTAFFGDFIFYTMIHIVFTVTLSATSLLHHSCIAPYFFKVLCALISLVLQGYVFTLMFKTTVLTVIMLVVVNAFLNLILVPVGGVVSFFKYFHVVLPGTILFTVVGETILSCDTKRTDVQLYVFDQHKFHSLPQSILLPVCIAIYAILLVAILAAPTLLALYTRKNDESDELDNKDITKERKRVEESGINEFTIVAKGLKKRFGRLGKRSFTAVFNATFGVSKGECFGLMGTNGAGKSTTFNMLTARMRPSAGNAYINGISVVKKPVFGFCSQGDAFLPDLTVYEFFLLFARLNGIRNAQSTVYVLLDCLRLVTRKDIMIKLCSGGEKRRIALGVALITDINVLMLDEPTTGVDPYTRRYIWEALLTLKENGSTMLLTTHSMEECEALCTRILFLAKGHMMALGTAQYLKHTMGDEYNLTVILKYANPETAAQLNTRFSEVFHATGNICMTDTTLRWTFKKTDKDLSELYSELDKIVNEIEGVADILATKSSEAVSSEASIAEEKTHHIIADSLIVGVTLEDAFVRLAEVVTNVKSII